MYASDTVTRDGVEQLRGRRGSAVSALRRRTKCPDLGRTSINPAFSSRMYASSTVATDTLRSWANRRTDGSRSPARSAPRSIAWPSSAARCSYRKPEEVATTRLLYSSRAISTMTVTDRPTGTAPAVLVRAAILCLCAAWREASR